MIDTPAFSPVAWLLPYNAEDMSLSAQRSSAHKELLLSQGVRWVDWDVGMHLGTDQFDVIVFTHPYDRERPRELWFDRVRSCVKEIVYVPYGLTVGAGEKNLRLQFAQPLQIGADLIVARSAAEKSMYARYCPVDEGRVQVLGHPRFDRLLEQLQTIETSKLDTQINGRMAVLWNSHFSFGHRFSQSSNFSSFDLLGPELIDYFSAHCATHCLIWRPHPGLFPELIRQKLLAPEELPTLRGELNSLGIVLDEATDHLPAFACSHALISDPGSFWFEYLATGKPLLPLINPEGEGFNAEAASLIVACGSASRFEDVACFIEAITEDRIDYERYVALRDYYLPLLDGKSGSRVCAALLGAQPPAIDLSIPFHTANERLQFEGVARHCSSSPIEMKMPPILTRLQAGLRRIRSEKKAQSNLRKWSRRQMNRVRTSAGEAVKRQPKLMKLAERVRNIL
ncbi:hypothetical protein [Ottowia sp. VDI28]|uniref:hypothetical protein n=1 Tax=Ottowia sp. VDI28 TaxID=3133968 RepID=UPI003C2FED1F